MGQILDFFQIRFQYILALLLSDILSEKVKDLSHLIEANHTHKRPKSDTLRQTQQNIDTADMQLATQLLNLLHGES